MLSSTTTKTIIAISSASLLVVVVGVRYKWRRGLSSGAREGEPSLAVAVGGVGLTETLAKQLEERERAGTLRHLVLELETQDNTEERPACGVDFASNDYFGLARDETLRADVEREYRRYVESEPHKMTGSTGSRLLSGDDTYRRSFELYLRNFHNGREALLFNSGFDANLSLLSCLPQTDTIVFFDELVHNSMREGMRLCRSKSLQAFKHNDPADLERRLRTERERNASSTIIIAIETVYSMDGDVAPLLEIHELSRRYRCEVIVDEAHGTGIFGRGGRGLVNELGLEKEIFARVHTFGKALGCHGAVIIMREPTLRSYLLNYARPLIYSTASDPHSVVAAYCAYRHLAKTAETRRARVEALLKHFHTLSARAGLELIASPSPIQAVMILGGNARVSACSRRLREYGFHMYPIRAPTVPAGKERLRVIIHSFNTEQEISHFVEAVGDFLRGGVDV